MANRVLFDLLPLLALAGLVFGVGLAIEQVVGVRARQRNLSPIGTAVLVVLGSLVLLVVLAALAGLGG